MRLVLANESSTRFLWSVVAEGNPPSPIEQLSQFRYRFSLNRQAIDIDYRSEIVITQSAPAAGYAMHAPRWSRWGQFDWRCVSPERVEAADISMRLAGMCRNAVFESKASTRNTIAICRNPFTSTRRELVVRPWSFSPGVLIAMLFCAIFDPSPYITTG